MDRYKKTSLKFDKNLGIGGNLRAVEINTSRAALRNSRFSKQRCFDDRVENSENKPQSKISTLGKPTLKAPMTRFEMLQKWKEEKEMKRRQELQNKKPSFKIGLSLPKSIHSSSTSSSKILSMKDSRMISYNPNSSSKLKKEVCLKPQSTTKTQALPLSSMKLSKSKEPQVQSLNNKPAIPQFSNSKVQKESHVQVPKKPKAGLQKPLFVSSKQSKNEEVRQAPMKSMLAPKQPFIAKSKLQPMSALPKIKITESKILKKPEQVQQSMPRIIPNGIPEPKSNPMQNSGRIIKGPSKIAAQVKSTGIPNKSGIKPKQERKPTKKTEESSNSNIAFECELSHIELAVERKSFAPKDFQFNPIANFSFSFLEEGPLAIYTRLKAGEERTSTPKRKELKEIQDKEAAKCLAEGGSETEQVSDQPEIQDTANSSYKQTTFCLPQSELSKEESIDVVATPSEAVKPLHENNASYIVEKECDVNRSLKACEVSCDAIKNNPEDKSIEENSKPDNSVTNVTEDLPVIKEIQIPPSVPASVSSEEQIENLTDVFYSSEASEPQTSKENCTNEILDNLESKVALENPITQEDSVDVPEEKKFVFEENETPPMAGSSCDPVKQIKATLFEGDSGIISRRRLSARSSNISVRGNRRSEMPQLESISESIESSPLKEFPPKPLHKKKSILDKDFTPRRSLRLSKRSELDTTENLFNVRPSLHGTPTDEEAGSSSPCNASNITYDFDKLHLESYKEPAIPQHRMSTRKGNKVSLLYTPPQKGRASTIRKSIKGDLMSFSPDV